MVIKTTIKGGEKAAIFVSHIVALFRNPDGTAGISLSNGEILDIADPYSETLSKVLSMAKQLKTMPAAPLRDQDIRTWLTPPKRLDEL